MLTEAPRRIKAIQLTTIRANSLRVSPETSWNPPWRHGNVARVSRRWLLARGRVSARGSRSILQEFQKLVRCFSPWGRHFLRVCQKRIVRRCKRKKFQGFENFGCLCGRKFTSLVSPYPAAFPGLF